MESSKALQDRVADAVPTTARTIHQFTIPPPLANGIKKIGMVQLTTAEELRATKRAQRDQIRLAYELTKQALVEVDGTTVGEADGSADKAWDNMPPKIRSLVLLAYANLHTPEEEDVDSFLKSQVSSVG